MQSALTGHMVLSTVHTNDAPSTVNRLLDMGAEDYLLTSTVNGILAQRLVRRLDPETAIPYEASPEVIAEFELEKYTDERPIRLWKAGSSAANPTGYRGRRAIMEFLVMSDPLRRLVMQRADAGEIERLARAEGMRTMYEDGIAKAVAGVTTLEEVLRVTQEG
jgi:general secretion pathway protein E